MAQKFATVFVLDVSQSMGPDLAVAGRSILMTLLSLKARDFKNNDDVAVFLIGSQLTHYRSMGQYAGYDGVYQLWDPAHEMAPVSVPLLSQVDTLRLSPSRPTGDVMGGLVWALDQISTHCAHYKYTKRVVVITHAAAAATASPELDSVLNQAIEKNVTIDVVAFGLGDEDEDEPTEPDPSRAAEPVLRYIAHETGGTVHRAEDSMRRPEDPLAIAHATSRPYGATWLYLGPPQSLETSISFPVVMCLKTKLATAPRPKMVSDPALDMESEAPAGGGAGAGAGAGGAGGSELDNWDDLGDLGGAAGSGTQGAAKESAPAPTAEALAEAAASGKTVSRDTHYKVLDENGELDASRHDVFDKSAVINAYRYGKAVVPVGEWETDLPVADESKGFEVIGFLPVGSIRREMYMETVRVVMADPKVPGADLRLAGLVRAMRARGVAALAKYKYNAKSGPVLVALIPHVRGATKYGLLHVELPTTQDVRYLSTMSLDFRPYLSFSGEEMLPMAEIKARAKRAHRLPGRGPGAQLMPPRFVPTTDQRRAMAILVANMTLVDSDDDAEDENDETDPGYSNRADVHAHESTNPHYTAAGERRGAELLRPRAVCHPLVQRVHRALEHRALRPDVPLVIPPVPVAGHSTAPVPAAAATQIAASQGAAASQPAAAVAANVDPAMAQLDPPAHLWAHPDRRAVVALVGRAFPTVKVEKDSNKRKRAGAAAAGGAGGVGVAANPLAKSTLSDRIALGGAASQSAAALDGDDESGRAAKRPAPSGPKAALIRVSDWRADFARQIAAQDVDNVEACITELAAIAADLAARTTDPAALAEAAECVRYLVRGANEHDGNPDLDAVMAKHRAERSPLWVLVEREGLWRPSA
ncbi:ATP-dependent DNA helicase yku80 [Blastocladiella emersonii ATCC 22665]|nr:ATP-dependent DNA helicase yku80 [Blastocladiella emersonii ATCC 22665]